MARREDISREVRREGLKLGDTYFRTPAPGAAEGVGNEASHLKLSFTQGPEL